MKRRIEDHRVKNRSHAIWDFVGGFALILAPLALGLMDVPAARNSLWIYGVIVILYSLLSESALSMRNWLPFGIHRAWDLVLGGFILGSPVIFDYRSELNAPQYLFHVFMGLAWIGSAILSRAPSPMQSLEEAPPEAIDARRRSASSVGTVLAFTGSLAMIGLVIWAGNEQGKREADQAGTSGGSFWQTGKGTYMAPDDQAGEVGTPAPGKKVDSPAQRNIDPASAQVTLEVKSLPNAPGFQPERLEVEAGTVACVRFENTSQLQHYDNFMVLKPGVEREVGLEGVSVGMRGGFIPDLPDKIIANTRTIPPGGSETVCFRVPEKPGRYPYISSARNRWAAMKGTLLVKEGDRKTG